MRLTPSALLDQAARALIRHKTRSALTALGIAIGIAAVVWVVAIGEAGTARAELLLQDLGDNLVWVEAGSRNVAGVRTGTHGTTSLTLDDAEAIAREIQRLHRVSPQVDGSIQAVSSHSNWATRFRGIAPDYLAIKRWRVAEGAAFTDEDVDRARNVCLLGQTVRERLFGADDPIGQMIRITGQPFEVVGLLAPKGQSQTGQDQDDTVMLPHTTAQRKLRAPRAPWVDDVVCSAVSPEAVAPASIEITQLMRQRHHIGPEQEDDFNIRHPEEVIKAQLEASRTLAALLITLASVSLLVGGIGIMNVMLASVTERTREIGVRLAVGATAGAVTSQFLAEAVLLCVFGGAVGVAMSVAGASAIGGALGWPLTIPAEALAIAMAFSVIVGVIFGLLPARRAARLDPIAALRAD